MTPARPHFVCCITTTVSTPSTWHDKGEAAQHVVGDAPAGVADHVRLAEVQAEHGEHVDAGVHAGDDGEVPARRGSATLARAAAYPSFAARSSLMSVTRPFA